MTKPLLPTELNTTDGRVCFRTKKELVQHWKIEYHIAVKEWRVLLLFLLVQYAVFVVGNITFYIQVNTLRREQHAILNDIGLPTTSKRPVVTLMPDILCATIVIVTILWMGFIICVRMERPLFLMIVLKRIFMHWSIMMSLCMASSLITTFPNPNQHCRLDQDSGCTSSDPEACKRLHEAMQPPSIAQILYRFDVQNGCQFLAYKMDAVYTYGLMLAVIKYASLGYVLPTMIAMGIEMILMSLRIASHSSYSVNAFMSLYVVPMVWFVLDAYVNDINNKDVLMTPEALTRFYGIIGSEERQIPSTLLSSDQMIDRAERGRVLA
uniref:Uncharacterized protein AlNc14C261G9810 n=1 Tax=Albugo laibachii Nc14 TaxID=890382 RepID=F0WCP8_9STRA|nr:conserved hypothetical protein [Albugo laibachii Nc14]CCA24831.1 conserved hypothetical protein [Albugo laibachii Nc14]|eukprot:CCA24831.1 conserved hypothetical protein [Albugo laibachii Nc14]